MTKAIPVTLESIFSFNMMRSVQSPRLFNVVAMNKKGKVLAVAEVDKEYDTAVSITEALNKTL